jgi:hypothetical protein
MGRTGWLVGFIYGLFFGIWGSSHGQRMRAGKCAVWPSKVDESDGPKGHDFPPGSVHLLMSKIPHIQGKCETQQTREDSPCAGRRFYLPCGPPGHGEDEACTKQHATNDEDSPNLMAGQTRKSAVSEEPRIKMKNGETKKRYGGDPESPSEKLPYFPHVFLYPDSLHVFSYPDSLHVFSYPERLLVF